MSIGSQMFCCPCSAAVFIYNTIGISISVQVGVDHDQRDSPAQEGLETPFQACPRFLCQVGGHHLQNDAYRIMEAMGYARKDCHFEVSGVNHFV